MSEITLSKYNIIGRLYNNYNYIKKRICYISKNVIDLGTNPKFGIETDIFPNKNDNKYIDLQVIM